LRRTTSQGRTSFGSANSRRGPDRGPKQAQTPHAFPPGRRAVTPGGSSDPPSAHELSLQWVPGWQVFGQLMTPPQPSGACRRRLQAEGRSAACWRGDPCRGAFVMRPQGHAKAPDAASPTALAPRRWGTPQGLPIPCHTCSSQDTLSQARTGQWSQHPGGGTSAGRWSTFRRPGRPRRGRTGRRRRCRHYGSEGGGRMG
jgi:hypothetical protein